MGTHIPISSSGTGNLAENKCLKECSALHMQHSSLPHDLRCGVKVIFVQSCLLQPWTVSPELTGVFNPVRVWSPEQPFLPGKAEAGKCSQQGLDLCLP